MTGTPFFNFDYRVPSEVLLTTEIHFPKNSHLGFFFFFLLICSFCKVWLFIAFFFYIYIVFFLCSFEFECSLLVWTESSFSLSLLGAVFLVLIQIAVFSIIFSLYYYYCCLCGFIIIIVWFRDIMLHVSMMSVNFHFLIIFRSFNNFFL